MMHGPVYSQTDFAQALMNLLPRGPAWPRDPDTILAAFWLAMAGLPKRNADAATGLLNDSPAFTLNAMLPEWEKTLDLPDDCAPAGQSFEQRVQAAVAKFAASGGQSAAYFLSIATALGYPDCTITQYAPFRAGRSHCGDPVGGEGWFFVWTLNAPTLAVSYFQCGSPAGSPLYSLNDNEIECTIERYAPAHTVVLFSGHA